LTRRWTSQIREDNIVSPPSSTTLEEGGGDQSSFGGDDTEDPKPRIVRTSVTGDMRGETLEVPSSLTTFMRRQSVVDLLVRGARAVVTVGILNGCKLFIKKVYAVGAI